MTYNEWFIKQNLLSETPYFMGELAWNEQQITINRLQMALADTEALEMGTAERLKKVTAENERLRSALEEVAAKCAELVSDDVPCGLGGTELAAVILGMKENAGGVK